MTDMEVEELREQYLQGLLDRADILISDFVEEANDLLDLTKGTEIESYECFSELLTALNAMAGAFKFHRGTPQKSDEYLAISKYGTWYTIRWSERFKKWNCFDEDTDDFGIDASEFAGYFDLPDMKGYLNDRSED